MKTNTLIQAAVAAITVTAFIGNSLPMRADETLTASQTVNITVDEIQQITVSGPAALHITTATAGSAPTAVTDATTTYSLTSNANTKKITAKIDSAMPTGMALILTMTAPSVGTSAGAITLTAADQDMVTGIGKVSETKALSYQLTATAAAGVLAATTRTVTLTAAM